MSQPLLPFKGYLRLKNIEMGNVIVTKGDYHKNNDLTTYFHLKNLYYTDYDNFLTENISSGSYRIDLHLPCNLDSC